tara:strand:+ start:161 stop:1063 length:903 start_codon:yes stop_codon:yes gene_type:complete
MVKYTNKTKKKIKKNKYKQKGGSKKDLTKCAPSSDKKHISCFSKKSLLKILEAIKNDNNNIKYSSNENIQSLWNKINEYFKNVCNDEWCWIEQQIVKNINDPELSKYTFRPKMPKKWQYNPHEWLNTLDIENVMKQYEKKYDDFKFIGPVPIDFDYQLSPGICVINELCRINVNHLLKKNIKKIGIIFNLDKHDQPGSHWVALFCDLNKGVYYFDSYGIKPPNEVNVLMDKLIEQNKTNNKMEKKVNSIRHQFKDSECGVYSMHFIIKFLEGFSFDQITRDKISDDDMFKNRKKYFIKKE